MFVERALEFAHAALDEPTDERTILARATFDNAIERVRTFDFTIGEARQIVLLVNELRAVMTVLERRASTLYSASRLN
jgi:hypothetical protein